MTIRKKAFVLIVCIAMIVAGTASTLAYFTDTDAVTNTFTVGKVEITLDEVKTDELGVPVQGADRVTENTYKLIPGYSYTKDPTVHIDADSEDAWVYVIVDNQIAAIEKESDSVASQMKANGWTAFTDKDGVTVYKYREAVKGGDDVQVFGSFTIAGDGVTNDTLNDKINGFDGKQIHITAYAIQAAGFDNAETAWNAAKGDF